MPQQVFRFRLKDDSGEFRQVSVAADSLEEAEATVHRQEAKKVAFQLTPEDLAGFEKRLKSGELRGVDRARLFAHRQVKPYVIQKGKGA